MKIHIECFPILLCVVMLLGISAFAQTPDRRKTNPTTEAQEQTPTLPPNATSLDIVANELGQLRKSLQTLNVRLREIRDTISVPDSNSSGTGNDKQSRILLNLDILTRAEQRAEVLRKQLFEVIEKETLLRTRLVQIEEDMRPENIERSMNLVGTTRTAEIRDVRRRVLESERKGAESLLSQTTQSRQRLEDDVRQADVLVSRLRQRVLPVIESEIDKFNVN